jgi:small subunit ribosomal protein S15
MTKIGDNDKSAIIKAHKQHDTDTGSSEVQIAILTTRINHLVDHLKKNKKDNHTRRGLLILVGRRQKLMKYLKKKNPDSLQKIAKKLKLKIK